MHLSNQFYHLSFKEGVWIEFYDKRFSSDLNLISSPVSEVMMLKVKENITKETVTNYGIPGVQTKCYDISNGSFWITDNDQWEYLNAERQSDQITLYYKNNLFDLEITYRLDNKKAILERSFTLEYKGSDAVYLHEALLTSPRFRNGTEGDEIQIELYDTRNHLAGLRHDLGKMKLLRGDRWPDRNHNINAMDCDIHHEVSFMLFNRSRSAVFACWGISDQGEAVAYTADETSAGIRFDQTFWAFANLKETSVIHCGSQIITHGEAKNWNEAIDSLQSLKPDRGFVAQGLPDELKKGLIYQLHGGIADFRGFKNLYKRLDRLNDLGVKILYLPPLAGPSAYLNYYPDQVASCFGTEEELRALVKSAHEKGMLVIVDMIAHDVYRHAPVMENDSFLRYDELGQFLTYALGTVLTETSNPDFRNYYIKCCKRLREELMIDGFRFDVSGFQLPNWQNPESRGYERPGMGVCGQTELLAEIRKVLGDDTIILEEGMGVQGFRYISHGWIQIIKRLRNESKQFEPVPVLLERIKIMLTDRRIKERINVESMLHAKIHDTALPQQLGAAINGVDLPLTILCLTSDCVPLISDGMERGYFEVIRKLAHLRQTCPEMSESEMNFEDVHTDQGEILAFSRTQHGIKSLVVINFSDKTLNKCLVSCNNFRGIPVFDYNCKANGNWEADEQNISIGSYGAVIFRSLPAPEYPQINISDNKSEYSDGTLPLKLKKYPELAIDLKFTYNILPADGIGKVKLSDSPDEGSMGGIIEGGGGHLLEDGPLGSSWYTRIEGFQHWPNAFSPSTRIPHICTGSEDIPSYIEDIFENIDEFSASRDPRMNEGKTYFRKLFTCKQEIKKAQFIISSPSLCCSGKPPLQTQEESEEMINRSNASITYLNGKGAWKADGEFPGNIIDVSDAIQPGENLLAVVAERGYSTRGIIAQLTLEYQDGSIEEIRTDESWQYFPGTIWYPAFTAKQEGFNMILVPLEETIQSRDKAFEGNLYSDENGKISLEMKKPDERLKPVWTISTANVQRWFAEDDITLLNESFGLYAKVRNGKSGSVIPIWQNHMFRMKDAEFGIIGEDGQKLSVKSESSTNAVYEYDNKRELLITNSYEMQIKG